jgi:VanZ family protein
MAPMASTNSPLRWIPALIMMGLIFLLSSLPASRLPDFGAVDFLVKKGSHATGYALLGLAYFYALPPRLSTGYRAAMALIMALLFALSDEYHQSFVEGRTSSLRDVFIDGGGAMIALAVASVYSSNSRSRSASS